VIRFWFRFGFRPPRRLLRRCVNGRRFGGIDRSRVVTVRRGPLLLDRGRRKLLFHLYRRRRRTCARMALFFRRAFQIMLNLVGEDLWLTSFGRDGLRLGAAK